MTNLAFILSSYRHHLHGLPNRSNLCWRQSCIFRQAGKTGFVLISIPPSDPWQRSWLVRPLLRLPPLWGDWLKNFSVFPSGYLTITCLLHSLSLSLSHSLSLAFITPTLSLTDPLTLSSRIVFMYLTISLSLTYFHPASQLLSPSLPLSLSLPLPLSLSLNLSLSLILFPDYSVSIVPSLSVNLILYVHISIGLYPSLTLTFLLCLSLSISFSYSHLSLSLSVLFMRSDIIKHNIHQVHSGQMTVLSESFFFSLKASSPFPFPVRHPIWSLFPCWIL